jgi:hypothetical protein
MWDIRNALKILVGKPEVKRLLGSPQVDWNKMDLKEIGLGGVYWIHLARSRDRWRAFMITLMNFQVP